MAGLVSTGIAGFITSAKFTGKKVLNAAGELVSEMVEHFVSGFAGYGWKIWEYVKGKWMLEIDSIRVREQFIVFEMLVSKMRAIIGSLGISQACGKIATVTLSEDGTEYLITLEDETMSFVAHDFMRCQTYTGTKQTFYHVEIASVVDNVIHVSVSEFDKDEEGNVVNPPEVGNDIVQFGNSVNKNRQSAIYIHADESGQPAIDIMFDIDSKDWTGKIKTRLGGDIPGGDGTRGFYCENGMIKGTDTSGHVVYCIHPDGSAEFGDGSAKFNTNKSGHIAGGAISWEWSEEKNMFICTMGEGVIIKWDNLDDETKENLKGESGIGIKETDVEYAISTSNTTSPTTGWQTTSPIWVDGKYIWSRTRIVYTDDSVIYTSAVCITGGKGTSGDDGKGIQSIIEQYYLSSSSSSLVGGGWQNSSPTWKNGWYIWTHSVITYTDNTNTTTAAICVTGGKGEDAVMYVIEFYIQGLQVHNIACDIHSKPVGGNLLIAKLYRIKGNSKELYSAGNWIVNHILNGTEVSGLDFSSPRSSVDIAIADVGDFDSISVGVAGGYSPDDPVISASGTIAKVMVNVPEWLTGWDTYKVQIGSEYMISPKLFTGKNTGTAEEPILTGIVQGDKCITINGETKSGFYGIKENEIVFSIDSDTADVSTVGDIIANAIKATGLNINNKFKVDKDGIVSSKGSVFDGVYVEGFICSKFSTSFDVDEHEYPKTMNYIVNEGTQLNISLPNDDKYIGAIMTVFLNRNLSSEGMIIGGNVSYNGKRITPLIKNKGTILRLMATYKVNNDLYWEVINFDNRNFALVNLTAVEGSNILFLLDRTTSANPDKSMSGTLKELSDYWDTI